MINKERKSIRTLTKEDKLSLSKDTDKTQEFFLRMSQRNFIKRHLSPIKTSRDFNFNKDKTAHHYNSYINTMKTDIIQVDKLLHKYSDVLAIHDNSCHNPAFQQRIAQLHTNRNIPIRNYFANILENSQSLEHLYKDFECRTKEDLIVRLSLENYFMNLYLNKLNDLIFVMSLKYYNSNNEYVQGYTESLSRFSHVKFLITRISEDNTIPEESSLLRKESNVSNISVNENGSILSLNNLNDFLNYETKDINLTHLKKLVIEYNHKSSKIFNDFVYFHCKENFTSMKSSDDLMANLIMLRKTIEDKLIQVKDENEKYNEEMTKLREELNKVKQLDLKKDFKDYLDQLDKRHEKFIYDMKNLENTGKDKLFDLLKTKTQKIDEIKIKCISLEEENKSLSRRIEVLKQDTYNDDTTSNEQYEMLLQEEYSKMRESFILRLTNLKNDYDSYKYDNMKINTRLNDELNINREAKQQLLKEIEDMKTNFRYILNL